MGRHIAPEGVRLIVYGDRYAAVVRCLPTEGECRVSERTVVAGEDHRKRADLQMFEVEFDAQVQVEFVSRDRIEFDQTMADRRDF